MALKGDDKCRHRCTDEALSFQCHKLLRMAYEIEKLNDFKIVDSLLNMKWKKGSNVRAFLTIIKSKIGTHKTFFVFKQTGMNE
jgi:hypothetical protein